MLIEDAVQDIFEDVWTKLGSDEKDKIQVLITDGKDLSFIFYDSNDIGRIPTNVFDCMTVFDFLTFVFFAKQPKTAFRG